MGMILNRTWTRRAIALVVVMGLALTFGCRRRKYENPITKDTLQPDKVLFDKAVNDIEKGRYEIARLTLNTLINTYDTSEFLAKAKLAIADTWFREGGSHGLAQAEAEYKDFILFYPTLEEAAEAQDKVCNIHFRQMEKADRDPQHALRAEDECRQLLVQFPNSKFAPGTQQRLREIQEAISDHEFRVGGFYHHKGSFVPAANRLETLVNQYPLFSKSDEALWLVADSYSRLGPRFLDRSVLALSRIVKDYPLSGRAEDAKAKLTSLEKPIPEPDPVALARMKYEAENADKGSMMSHFWGIFSKSPDVRAAAKSGAPAMTSLKPTVPVSVPSPADIAAAAAGTAGAASADVTVSTVTDTTALDSKPDARQNPPKPAAGNEATTSTAQPGDPQAAPQKPGKKAKKAKKAKNQPTQ
jgi:outer membrane protein assembly factor BamD